MSSGPNLDEDPKKIIAERTVQVREEIRKALRRVALVLQINDRGIAGYVDAACKIDRRAIVIEELKELVKYLEDTNAYFVQETWRDIRAEAREQKSSGIRPSSVKGDDPFSL